MNTNLADPDEEPVVFGPYGFETQEGLDDWVADMDVALGDLNNELRFSQTQLDIKFSYDEYEGIYSNSQAPAVEYLVNQVRQLWQEQIVTIRFDSPVL